MTSGLAWVPRTEPLAPTAVVAEGAAAERLARRLLALTDEVLARLAGISALGMLAMMGAEADLPWVDGVRYFGRDPEAPSLLVPTAVRCTVPLALLERGLSRAAPAGSAPLLVLENPLRLASLGVARPVERTALSRWLEAQR